MKTVVVNKYNSEYDVDIQRGTVWGNPYFQYTRHKNIELFKKHFINLINDGTITKSMLLSLKGKRLGCTCYPKCCHGDVIASFVNSINENMLDI